MANDAENTLGLQIANPQALGFGVLAILGWIYSMVAAGWFPQEAFGTTTSLDVATLATFALLVAALAGWGLGGLFWVISGYIRLVTALVAFWIAAQEVGAAAEAA